MSRTAHTLHSSAPPGGRIDDIEWLRAVAVLGVVVHHASDNLYSWSPAWIGAFLTKFDLWSGVDIFFVISGFVIARRLLPNLAERAASSSMRKVAVFWLARAFRLLPSAWLWLGLTLVACAAFNHSGAFGSWHANVMATLAGICQVANFRFASAFASYEYGASFVYWSLSLEEQFYLLLPLLMLVLRRALPVLLIALVIVQALSERGLLMIALRTDALAWGVLLAWLEQTGALRRFEPRVIAGRRWLAITVSVMLIVGIAAISAVPSWPFGRRVSAVAPLALILVWIASYNQHYLSGRDSLFKRFMLWTGARSYAIYLIHVPAFMLIRKIWFRLSGAQATGGAWQTLIFSMLAIALIGCFAQANYRWIERPLRALGKRVARQIEHGSAESSIAPLTSQG